MKKTDNGIRLFFTRLAVFLLVLVCIDIGFGGFSGWFFFRQETGKYARLIYTMDKAEEDIIIFGSSHANRHYDPRVFERELSLSCYNAGVQGQELVFINTLFEIMISRHSPKIIILNLDKNWLLASDGWKEKITELNPFYGRHPEEIGSAIEHNSSFERYKLISRLYRYNSTWVHMLRYLADPQQDYAGYLPLTGTLKKKPEPGKPDAGKTKIVETDPFLFSVFRGMITTAKRRDILIIAVVSPQFLPDSAMSPSMKKMTDFLQSENIYLLNHSCDTSFAGKADLFYDASHLNSQGAELFSGIVASEIKRLLE